MSKYVFNLTGPEMEAALNKATKVVANPEITGSEAALESIEIADTKYKLGGGGGLPTPANAGDAMVYNGTEWAKQSGYGYLAPATGETVTWDGDTTGKVSGTLVNKAYSSETLYKISDTPITYANFKDDDTFTLTDGTQSMTVTFNEVYKVTNSNAELLCIGDFFLLNIEVAGSYIFKLSDDVYLYCQEVAAGVYTHKLEGAYISEITCNHAVVLTWDGDITGKTTVELIISDMGLSYCKINDVIDQNAFITASALVINGSGAITENISFSSEANIDYMLYFGTTPFVLNVRQAGSYSFTIPGEGAMKLAIPEPGLYAFAMCYGNSKIKLKYFNAIADEYISNIVLADEITTVPNPIWDGEMDGKAKGECAYIAETTYSMYKVSDKYADTLELFKSNCKLTENGASEITPDDEDFIDFTDGYAVMPSWTTNVLNIKQPGSYNFTDKDGYTCTITVPAAGLYFKNYDGEYVEKYSYGIPAHIEKLNESYIPKNPKVENAVEYNGLGTVDFATTVSTIYNNGGSGSVVLTNIETSQTHIIYKGSELHPSKYAKSFIGQDMWLYSGIGLVNITADTIFTDNNALAITYENSIRIFEIQKATTSTEPGYITINGVNYSYVGEPGTYFYDTEYIRYLAPIYNKIDENLVPSVGGSGAGTFIATYGETAYTDISAAIDEGKSVYCKFVDTSDNTLLLTYSCKKASDNTIIFTQTALSSNIESNDNDTTAYACIASITTSNTWTEDSAEIQQKLVSGTDIKTINTQSILGSGNLNITSTFIATYETTTYSSIMTAYNAGKTVLCKFTENGQAKIIPLVLANSVAIMFCGSLLDAEANKPIFVTIAVYSNNNWVKQTDYTQKELVSGIDIKTINNQSVLGSGNLDIAGGVTSVNGKTGTVSLTANDVGATTESYVNTKVSTKQDSLVSGTNIKTINNTSILGSGNLPIISDSVSYTTTAPTADNPDGLKFIVLDSEPAARYNGWFYIITD